MWRTGMEEMFIKGVEWVSGVEDRYIGNVKQDELESVCSSC